MDWPTAGTIIAAIIGAAGLGIAKLLQSGGATYNETLIRIEERMKQSEADRADIHRALERIAERLK